MFPRLEAKDEPPRKMVGVLIAYDETVVPG